MLNKFFLYILPILSSCILLTSCNNNPLATPEEHSFSLIEINYILNENERDGLDSTTHHLQSYELRNISNKQMELTYFEEFDGLNKTSHFTLSSGTDQLPRGLEWDTIVVPTPTEINDGEVRAATVGWSMVDTLQEKSYDYLKPTEQVVNVPGQTMIMVDRTINEDWATVSFTAEIRNDDTGERHTVTGKWSGTLRFSYYSVVLNEHPLNSSSPNAS